MSNFNKEELPQLGPQADQLRQDDHLNEADRLERKISRDLLKIPPPSLNVAGLPILPPQLQAQGGAGQEGSAISGTNEQGREGVDVDGGKPPVVQKPPLTEDQVPRKSKVERPPRRLDLAIRSEPEAPELGEIAVGFLVRLNELFVPSDDYVHHLETGFTRTEGRIFIVHGPEHSGKFTTAVALGLELQGAKPEESKFANYLRRPDDRMSLLRFASEEMKDGGICILRDAFAHNVALETLRSSALDVLNAALDKKQSYLILTTEHTPDRLEVNVAKVGAMLSGAKLDEVFAKHADRYARKVEGAAVRSDLIDLARNHWPNLKGVLRQPAQIDRFFHRLGEFSGEVASQALEELAQQAATLGRDVVAQWFGCLRLNEKLLALLIGILPELRLHRLEDIYGRAVKALRHDGWSRLRDAREIGFDELLRRVAAMPVGGELAAESPVRFNDSSYADEIARQVRSHHELLWSLTPIVIEMNEESSVPPWSALRRIFGTALARAGWSRPRKLFELVARMARHPSTCVVAVVGYALAEVYRLDHKSADSLNHLLEIWTRSGDFDLMWAVSPAIWQICEAIAQVEDSGTPREQESAAALRGRLFNRLRDLAESAGAFDEELLHCKAAEGDAGEVWLARAELANLENVATALYEMTFNRPARTVPALVGWLAPDEPADRQWTALVAIQALFFQVAASGDLLASSVIDFLPLVEPLLELDIVDTVVSVALQALRIRLDSPSVGPQIVSHLIRLAGRCSDRAACNLIAGLAREWLTSDSVEACRLGHALIARCAALHGASVLPAGLQRGLVAAEASATVPGWLARGVHSMLAARLDASLVCLGDVRPAPPVGLPLVKRWEPVSAEGRPLLLLPALEAACPRPATTVLLSRGQVLDLADSENEGWLAHLIRVIVGEERGPEDEALMLYVGSAAPARALGDIAARLDAVLGRILAQLDHDACWQALAPSLGVLPEERDRIWTQVEAWADQVEHCATATGDQDPARQAVAAILWLAGGDLRDAAVRLVSWCADGAPPTRRLLAAAAGKVLFRVWSHRQPPPVRDGREILALASPLVKSGWGGAFEILGALRWWLNEAAWAESLLGDWEQEVEEGMLTWVSLLVTLYPREVAELLRVWRGRPAAHHAAPSPDVPEDILSSDSRFALRLSLRLALASAEALPELAAGRNYVALVVDAAVSDAPTRELMGELAAGVVARWREAAKQSKHPKQPELPPALLSYRLGDRLPLALPGERVKAADLLDLRRRSRPRLLSPLFETLPRERVDAIVLLLAGPMIDAEDWTASDWLGRLHVYDIAYQGAIWKPGQQLSKSSLEGLVEEMFAAALAAPGERSHVTSDLPVLPQGA